jgi:hypothetical protein
MTFQDPHPRTSNGADSSSRSHSTEPGNRGRFPHAPKNNHLANVARADKKSAAAAVKQQRVPNADDFPVLAGSTTPPARSPGHASLTNGHPTAAQVLQAPAPNRKDSGKELSTRTGTPESESAKVKQII